MWQMANNEIVLYGSVGMSWWEEEYFTAASVRAALAGRQGPLTVRLNSGGGIATEGQAIYTMLVDYPDTVTIIVDGVAASAASLIAMAGDEIVMRMGSWMLIHDPAQPYTEARGTEDDHLHLAQQLAVISGAYAEIYANRAGITIEAAREIMRAETIYDGRAAVDAGFASAYDGAQQAAAAARFDYRMYAHAPAALRDGSIALGVSPGKAAVLAMIAGETSKGKGVPAMSNNLTNHDPAVTAPGTVVTAPGAVLTVTPAPSMATNPEQAKPANATIAERTRMRRIMDGVAAAGLPPEFANTFIDDGSSVETVLDAIIAKKKENDVDTHTPARPQATIVRDERDTRRAGMAMALTAQLTGNSPASDQARPYMAMSIVEMAAETVGWSAPIRTAGDRQSVLMAASHTTGDFPFIFENALNKVLLERYEVQAPTYRRIARRRDFNDFRPHPLVRAGDFPTLLPVAENGEIRAGSFGESKETAVLVAYARKLSLTRQMLVNDDLNAIMDILNDYGSAIADFEEATAYNFLTTGLMADGQNIFHSTHNNLAGAGTAITVVALAAGRAAIRKQVSVDGKKLNLAPSILLVGPDKETEAEQLVTTITPALAGSVNPFSGRLEVITTAHITGNPWHLFADPARAGGSCMVYGYLNGAAAPRIRTDEPFGQQGMQMSVELDFGLGFSDFRGAYRNPGA
jgi:ATP-dependent protease ClpP protease subunit